MSVGGLALNFQKSDTRIADIFETVDLGPIPVE
jgi:hypothetical protein